VPDWSNLAVTTHIIGKPPAPKGGATFGDVPDRHVFSMPWRKTTRKGRRSAEAVWTTENSV